MNQTVTVTRIADRHDDLHKRRFAETEQISVPAGPLADVVSRALEKVPMPEGSYVITVDWPYE